MRSLLIYTFVLGSLSLGISNISSASEINSSLHCQCTSTFTDILKFMCGYEEDQNNPEDNYIDIDGFPPLTTLKEVKWELLATIYSNYDYDRSAVINQIAEKSEQYKNLYRVDEIPEKDLEIFIKHNIPQLGDEFDSEETYEVTKILILNGYIDVESLEAEVFKFTNGEKC